MEPYKDVKTLLSETLELKNLNLERLAQMTGVPERYLWAIQNLEIDKLPPAPYVKGYIEKISKALNLHPEELWGLYKKELDYKTAGTYDKLPVNRFAIKYIPKTIQFLIVIAALILIYGLINLSHLLGEPKLVIGNPAAPITTVSENIAVLSGEIKQRDKLTINDEEIFVNQDGTFSKEYLLQPGFNSIEFKVKRFLGREKTMIRQILYQPK
jgi:cytoskeletal protein RodZ